MALTESKPTVRHGSNYDQYSYGIAAGAQIFMGALIILALGYARPGRVGQGADNTAKAADAATYRAVGVASRDIVGGATDGAVSLEVLAGEFEFENATAGDALTIADIGNAVYILDDETVAKTNPNNTRAKAGILVNFNDTRPVVRVGPGVQEYKMRAITQPLLESLRTGFQTVFKAGLGKAKNVSDVFTTVVKSNNKVETYAWLVDLAIFGEWVGKKKIKQLSEKVYQLINRAYEVTIGIHKHAIEDDSLGLYGPQVAGWGQDAGELKDRLSFEALSKGHVNTCFDGLPFFSENHKIGKKTFSNKSGDGTKNPIFFMCLNKSILPILYQNREDPHFHMITDMNNSHVFDTGEYLMGGEARGAAGYTFWQLAHRFDGPLTADAFDAIKKAFAAITNENGEKLGLRPTHVVFGASNFSPVKTLFGNEKLSGGGDNIWFKAVELIEADLID